MRVDRGEILRGSHTDGIDAAVKGDWFGRVCTVDGTVVHLASSTAK